MVNGGIEVVDLLSSSDDENGKRNRDDTDVIEIIPPAKKIASDAAQTVVLLDSDVENSSPPPNDPPPMQRLITLKYKSLVPGARGQGTFELRVSDSFQTFAEKFSSDKDDLEIRGCGFTTSWFGTPEIFLLDDPDAETVDVVVVSKEAGSDDEEAAEEKPSGILIRINTPKGRLEIRVREDHTIKKVAEWVATQQGIDASKIKAEFDSDPVSMTDTIGGLEIEEEDLIDMSW